MIRKFVLRLVRTRLKLAESETFQFVGQNSPDTYYYFTDGGLVKAIIHRPQTSEAYTTLKPSGVSLNYILSDDCKIRKVYVVENTIIKPIKRGG